MSNELNYSELEAMKLTLISEITTLLENPHRREPFSPWREMELNDLTSHIVDDPIFMVDFFDFQSRNKSSFSHPNQAITSDTVLINNKKVFISSSLENPKFFISQKNNCVSFDSEEIPLLMQCCRKLLIVQLERMLEFNLGKLLMENKLKLARCLKFVGIGNKHIIEAVENFPSPKKKKKNVSNCELLDDEDSEME